MMDGAMGSMMGWMMSIGLLGWVLVIALLITIVVLLVQLLWRTARVSGRGRDTGQGPGDAHG